MVVYGKNEAIVNADEIKIEYHTYWAKPNGKSRLVSSTLMKREQISTLIDEEKSNTGFNFFTYIFVLGYYRSTT